MKKIIALLLTLAMVFAFVACSTPCEAHVDADKDGKCDECGAEVQVPCETHKDENLDRKCDVCQADVGTPEADGGYGVDLINGVLAQLESAKTLNYTMDVTLKATQGEATAADMTVAGEAVLTKADNTLGFNAMIDVEIKMLEGTETVTQAVTLYIIDDFGYSYDATEEAWIKVALTEVTDAIEMITQALGEADLTIDEATAKEIVKALGSAITENVQIKDGKITGTLDYKALYDDLVAYVNAIDPATMTVEELINDVLALADEELTYEALVAEVKAVLELTVNEAIAEIDAALTEQYETTLQGLFDTIVNDEQFVSAITGIMVGQGMPETEVAAYIAQIQAIKIAEVVTGLGIGEETLYDVIVSMVAASQTPDFSEPEDAEKVEGGYEGVEELEDIPGEEPAGAPTLDEAITMLNGMVKMTLNDAGIGEMLTMVKTYLAMIDIDKYVMSTEITLGANYAITKVTGSMDFDVVVTVPDQGAFAVTEEADFELVPSETAAQIALPAGAEVIDPSAAEKAE